MADLGKKVTYSNSLAREPRSRETIRFRDDGSMVHVVVAASPIRMGDELHGMVAVYTDISKQKNAEDKLLRLNQSLKTLSAGNMALVRATDEKILLNDVCNILVKIGGYTFAWVGFAKSEKDTVIHVAARAGRDKGYLNRVHFQLKKTMRQSNPVARAIGNTELTVCRYTSNSKQTGIWYQEGVKRKFASSLSLPLSSQDEVFGALNIYSSDPNAFDEKEVDLLTEMATDLAFGIGVLRARIAHQKAESEKEKMQLLKKLKSLGLLSESGEIDDVLGITLKDLLDRRLQSIVLKKGLARSMKQARQFIVHGHVMVDSKKITSPNFLVPVDKEAKVGFLQKHHSVIPGGDLIELPLGEDHKALKEAFQASRAAVSTEMLASAGDPKALASAAEPPSAKKAVELTPEQAKKLGIDF